jgi:hypothetical protein
MKCTHHIFIFVVRECKTVKSTISLPKSSRFAKALHNSTSKCCKLSIRIPKPDISNKLRKSRRRRGCRRNCYKTQQTFIFGR